MTAHYVYRCYGKDGRLLYVGQTKDWTARLATHRKTAFWAPEVVQVRVAVHRSPEVARAAERKAIINENPRFNYQGRWQTRATWDRQAWQDYIRTATAGPYCNCGHIETVFRQYAATFGEVHPLAQSTREEWAARDARNAAEWAKRSIETEAQRRRIEAADRLSMLDHFRECEVCAMEGDYSDECPETLACLAADGAA